MEQPKTSKCAAQALRWLRKMGIEASPVNDGSGDYEFCYNDTPMLISTTTPEGSLIITALVYLLGDSRFDNSLIHEYALREVEGEMEDFMVGFGGWDHSYVSKLFIIPPQRGKLRRYQIKKMLDEVNAGYDKFLFATMMYSISVRDLDLDLDELTKDL